MAAVLPPAHTTALLSSRLIRAPYGLHPPLEGAPGEGTVADTVPPLKHQLRLEPAPVCHPCARAVHPACVPRATASVARFLAYPKRAAETNFANSASVAFSSETSPNSFATSASSSVIRRPCSA